MSFSEHSKSRKQEKRTGLTKISHWSATHPWYAVGLWIVFVAACFIIYGSVETKAPERQETIEGEARQSFEILASGNFNFGAKENVLITAKSGELNKSLAKDAAKDVSQKLKAYPVVFKVNAPSLAKNNSAFVITFSIDGDPLAHISQLTKITETVQKDYPTLRIEQVGETSIKEQLNKRLGEDLEKAAFLSLPVTLIILLIAFGAIIAAGVPVLLALSNVIAAMGLYAIASHFVPDAGMVPHIVMLMGMGVSVDYSLFYLKRVREEKAKGSSDIDAIDIAAATSGHTIIVSGIAVIIAVIGLYLSNALLFYGVATGVILVVAIAMLGSLTVLPALITKLGKRMDWPRIPILWRWTNDSSNEHRLWEKILKPVLKYPKISVLFSLVVILALASPVLDVKLRGTTSTDLPRSITIMQSYDRLIEAFPSKGTIHEITVRSSAEIQPEVKKALEKLAKLTQRERLFAHDELPQVITSSNKTVSVLNVATPFPRNSDEGDQSLIQLRELTKNTVGQIKGIEYAVGGSIATSYDFTTALKEGLPWVLGFVLTTSFIMVVISFRSLFIALTTIVCNLLSMAAAYGVVTLVFQNKWAENLLDFQSNGTIASWLPLLMFAVLFGLSMDYHMFMVNRIREGVLQGMPIHQAIAFGAFRSAGTVVSAAIIMASVLAIFASLSLIEMKQLGVGLAVGFLVDALIIRTILLPSLMILLGKLNWWPSNLLNRSQSMKETKQINF